METKTCVRRLIFGAALGIASLLSASAARADLQLTLTDVNSISGTVATTTITQAGPVPMSLSFGPATSFGNFLLESASTSAFILAGPTAFLTNDNITTEDVSTNGGTDKLTITATTSGDSTASPPTNWAFNQPDGNPLRVTSSLTSSNLSTGATALFNSTLLSTDPITLLPTSATTPNTSITGAGHTSVSGPDTSTLATSNGMFNLSNTLTIVLTTGQTATVDATTSVTGVVPEPATFGTLLTGGLLSLGMTWSRRRRRA